MAPPAPPPSNGTSLRERMASLGRVIGAREAANADALGEAFAVAKRLHGLVADALEAFHTALEAAGGKHLHVMLGVPRLDEKHVHAVQFELLRGRAVAIVTVRSRGEVTLVGPFAAGKAEGPCQKISWDDAASVEQALENFLARFVDEATKP